MDVKNDIIEGAIEVRTDSSEIDDVVEAIKEINEEVDEVNIIVLKHKDGRIELEMPPLPSVESVEELIWGFEERCAYLRGLSKCAVEAWIIAKSEKALDEVIERLKEIGFKKGVFKEAVGESKKGDYKKYVYT